MIANRISYWLNLRGPSHTVEASCCSSLVALQLGRDAIARGYCDAAIIGGSRIMLQPQHYINYNRMVPISFDGKTKCYDMDADGHILAEAITVLFLQKYEDAKRIYAEIYHMKSNFSYDNFGKYRDHAKWSKHLEKFYEEAGVSPSSVEYVEGCGAADPKADRAELQALEEVLCKDRKKPLLVGSVTSNIGSTGETSGLCGLIKLLLAYHRGELAANLHCDNPRKDVPALQDGRMQIVTEHAPFARTYTALNNFAITGMNSHLLLKGHYKEKGRQESGVQKILDHIKSKELDPEEIALHHGMYKTKILNHMARGFGIYETVNNKTVTRSEKKRYYDSAARPLWFVYSGMGSQWAGMGEQLMRIPIFAAAIERCDRVLKPKGLDIVDIISNPDKSMFDNILNSFVGIAAIQIGLTDVLRAVGLVPDNVIGHSVGELGCAYADDCLTDEEMISLSYSRGIVSTTMEFVRGSMAAVGIGFKQMSKICPPDIDVACHNGPGSCTISGPEEIVCKFVNELTGQGPELLKMCKELIKEPKLRSKRWISTSVEQSRWDEYEAQYSTAAYHVNNMMSPVLFEEGLRHVPNDAVLIEIAPHGLMQAILKRSLASTCTNVALTSRDHPDNVLFLLEALGELYMDGFDIDISVLYPKIEFPVSTKTNMLSHLVEWVHTEQWYLTTFEHTQRQYMAVYEPLVTKYEEEYTFLEGAVIEGTKVFPLAQALIFVWDTLSMITEKPVRETSVNFHKIVYHKQPVWRDSQVFKLVVMLHRGSGLFEVTLNDILIVEGVIQAFKFGNELPIVDKNVETRLDSNDVYKLLFEKGYEYRNDFRTIYNSNHTFTRAQLVWRNNWVTFIDGAVQLYTLKHGHEGVSQPHYINSICIDLRSHEFALTNAENYESDKLLDAIVNKDRYDVRCGGLSIESISFKDKPIPKQPAMIKILPQNTPSSDDINKDSEADRELNISVNNNLYRKDCVAALRCGELGDLDSLYWQQVPRVEKDPGLIDVKVHYAELNNFDVQRALAQIPRLNTKDQGFGISFSGITESGQKVMGVFPSGGSVTQQITSRPEFLWPIPKHWSLEDATTVPLAYSIAFRCLDFKNRLDNAATILVHGGAGALGQAVISIALATGYQVYTTVSDQKKKKFLTKLFPNLPADHIGNSRDNTFKDMVMFHTRGRGCDLVICCVKGALKDTSLSACAEYGTTFDLAQIHSQENYEFGMYHLTRARNYVAVDIASIFDAQNIEEFKKIRLLIVDSIRKGYVRPLTRATYAPRDVSRAFRLLATSGQRGRVLIEMQHEVQNIHPRHWEKLGAKVKIVFGNTNIEDIMNGANEGIYVVATDLEAAHAKDNVNVMIHNLDVTSRQLCPGLRYFTLITEDGLVGKSTCQARKQSNLNALSIQIKLKTCEEKQNKNGTIMWGDALDALEIALLSNETFVVVNLMEQTQRDVLQEVAKITGVTLTSSTDGKKTLQEIGINYDNELELNDLLANKFNFTKDFLPYMTVEQLKNLNDQCTGVDNRSCFAGYFSTDKGDETLINADMVFMPTLTHTPQMLPDEYEPDETFLCIVPGMENNYERFRALCELLKLPAVVLHYDMDHQRENIQQIAQRLVNSIEAQPSTSQDESYLQPVPSESSTTPQPTPISDSIGLQSSPLQDFSGVSEPDVSDNNIVTQDVIMKKLTIYKDFYLLGYEFGIPVVLEMAAILESYGLSGTVICLGGTPNEIQADLENNLHGLTEDTLQIKLLKHFHTLFLGKNIPEIEENLLKIPHYSDKVKFCVDSLRAMVANFNEEVEMAGSHNHSDARVPFNRVVISGMSALMPGCTDLDEFNKKLYNKENFVTDQNPLWQSNHPEVNPYRGSIPGLDRFDAQYFMIHYRLAQTCDSTSRKILEQAYQAIIDAGVSPSDLSGKRIGVFIGNGFDETFKLLYVFNEKGYSALLGTSKAMIANRISYWLNLKGPSFPIDASCCSSIVALQMAREAIAYGHCDAAIIGGSRIMLQPHIYIHRNRLNPMSPDGKSKCYDVNAEGFIESENVSVLFLQKYEDAKRIYAEVCHVKSDFCYDTIGKYRDPAKWAKKLEKFYEEAGVSPSSVEYVEGCGAADPVVDKAELESLEQVFCKDRKKPLLVGSVVSNIGSTGETSGLCGVIKLLLAYHRGELAANLHCDNPRKDVPALQDGRMQIVTEHAPFARTYTALNNFAITGMNSHLLLKGHYKEKDVTRYQSSIPRLVLASGRQESGVQKILDHIKSKELDPEEIVLYHEIHKSKISNHMARGFAVYETKENKTVTLSEKTKYYDTVVRPLWFVYSGMGSQWAGMGEQLMRIPIFAAAIERCDRVLKPKGLDIVDIISNPDKSMFDNILNSFVGIAAIQIGLTDILRAVGLVPDNVIGHSVGELGCAYADGCVTAEEMILLSYNRGIVSTTTEFTRGTMAAVGMGFKQISKICPPEIDVACHNGPESCTISGPKDVMSTFVNELTARGVFAKEVQSSNIAYHSRYVAQAGPKLLEQTRDVIKEPKLRSKRWISTSVEQSRWDEPEAQYSTPAYHVNNMMSPVLFEEGLRHVPNDAVLIEIAPHGLMQAILKRSLASTCTNVALTRRGHPDNVLLLLEALGTLYMEGYDMDISVLYPKIEFPVSTQTGMLSHLVEWVHSEKWHLSAYDFPKTDYMAVYKPLVTKYNEEYKFLEGSVVEGIKVFPLAQALIFVWDTLSMITEKPVRETSVKFHKIVYHKQPVWRDSQVFKLVVMLHRGSGRFEVSHENVVLVEGFIQQGSTNNDVPVADQSDATILDSSNVYKLLFERGYEYKNDFRVIHSSNKSFTKAQLIWRNNWVTFIDGALQLCTLRQNHKGISQPQYINCISIDVRTHMCASSAKDCADDKILDAVLTEDRCDIRCGGLKIEQVSFKNRPIVKQSVTMQSLKLVPVTNNIGENACSVEKAVLLNKQYSKEGVAALRCGQLGDVNTMYWAQVPDVEKQPGHIHVKVHYAELNNYDAQRALARIPVNNARDQGFGMSFSGITEWYRSANEQTDYLMVSNRHHPWTPRNTKGVTSALPALKVSDISELGSGQKVMGISPSEGSVSQRIVSRPEFLWPVPEHWSLEDAATVPLAYSIAFYCLNHKTRLDQESTILVHGGAGALGQAVISIALATGYQVFTTVSDQKKKKFLTNLFPNLPADHIGNSRDETFRDMVMVHTRGKGADVVISCVKGYLKNASLSACAEYGTTFDLAQIHSQENYEFGMYHMTRARNYVAVDIASIFDAQNIEEFKKIKLLIARGINKGYVRPLTRVTYAPRDVSRAFQLLAANRQRGRVLIDMQCEALRAESRISLSNDTCQVVIGGEDGFVCNLANMLVERGARKLYLHMPKISEYCLIKKEQWEKLGAKVKIVSDNTNTKQNIEAIIKEAKSLGHVEGIYVVATDLEAPDAKDKVYATIRNIDDVSRRLCPELIYFAIVTEDGSIGRSVCQSRKQDNLISLVMQIKLKKFEDFEDEGAIMWGDALDALETALLSNETFVVVNLIDQTQKDVLQEVAKIPGVTLTSSTDESLMLQEIGIDQTNEQVLCNLLADQFNFNIPKDLVSYMTVKQLKTLNKQMAGVDNTSCFAGYFSTDKGDETLINADMVFMPTLTHTPQMLPDEYEPVETFLCIVPGMENNYERFRALCELLKLPAVVLHYDMDHQPENIQQIAQRLVNVLMKKLKMQKEFYLLGYEFGIPVVIEMAAILESYGLSGTVFCLGGTPTEIRNDLEHKLQGMPEERLQITLLKHLHSLLLGKNIPEIEERLSELPLYSEKVKFCVDNLRGRVSYKGQYLETLMEAAYSKINVLRNFDPEIKTLKAKIVILRAQLSQELPTDETMELSQQNFIIHELDATLGDVPHHLKCPSIINDSLGEDILTRFNKRNHCVTYNLSV
ncbi:unnamed protein product [Spodoptera exigua]|nr:unnamed protein product [Spodoptera exigua]